MFNEKEETNVQEFMTFNLGKTLYAISISNIVEVLVDYPSDDLMATAPHSHSWIVGLFEKRGHIMPIADLRIRFAGNNNPSYSVGDLISVTVKNDAGTKHVTLIFDSVNGAMKVNLNDVDSIGTLGFGIPTNFLKGMCSLENSEMLVLFDIEEVIDKKYFGSLIKVVLV